MAKSGADRRITYNLLAKYDRSSDKAFDTLAAKTKAARDSLSMSLSTHSAAVSAGTPSHVASSIDADVDRAQAAADASAAAVEKAAAKKTAAERLSASESAAAAESAADRESKAADKQAERSAAASEKAAKAAEKAAEREAAARERAAEKAAKAAERAAEKAAKARERETQKAEAAAEREAKAQERAAEKAAKAKEAAAEKAARDAERAAEKEAAAKEREAKAAEKAEEKQAAASERAAEKEAKAKEASARRGFLLEAKWERMAERAQEKKEKAAERTERAAKTAEARAEKTHERSNKAAINAGKGVLEVAKGILELDLASESTTEKLLQGPIKIQGAFNVLSGGIEIYENLHKAAKLYALSVEQGAVAEQVAAAAQAAHSAAEVGRVGLKAISAAESAAGASGATSTAISAVNAAGSAASGAGSLASLAPAGAASAAAASAVPVLAWTAALAGSVLAIKSGVDVYDQLKRHALGAGAEVGSWTDKIATSEAGVAEWIASLAQSAGISRSVFSKLSDSIAFVTGGIAGPFLTGIGDAAFGAAESAEALEKLAKASEREAQIRERNQALDAGEYKVNAGAAAELHKVADQRAVAREMSRNGGDEDAAKFATTEERLNRRLAELKVAYAAASNFNGPEGRNLEGEQAALDRAKQLEQEILDIEMEQQRAVREKNKTAVDSLKQQLELEDRKLKSAQDQLKTSRQSLQSDRSKFADLDPFQQAAVRRAKEKLDSGKDLNKEESGLLSQFDAFGEKSQANRAKQGGKQAGDLFSEAEQRVQHHEQEVKRIQEIKANVQLKLSGEIELGEHAAREIAAKLKPQLDGLERLIKESVDNAAAKLGADMNKKFRLNSANRGAASK